MSAPPAPQPVALEARDGRTLAGVLLEAGAARGALAINGATGFRREFYLKFATYSAQRGYHSLRRSSRSPGATRGCPSSPSATASADS